MRPTTTFKAGLIQPKLILDSKALGLTTEACSQTAGRAVYVSRPIKPTFWVFRQSHSGLAGVTQRPNITPRD